MRIAFVGLPQAALLLAADGHTIVWAGLCRRGAVGTRRLKRLLGSRVEIVPDLEARAGAIGRERPDLLVSWYWTKRIPKAVRGLAPLGAFGVHPSLLPRHRGPDPTFWAIDSGDAETGVTAHLIDDAYDTGAILGQRRVAIDPSWSAWTLAKKLDRPSLALLREVAAAYARGAPPVPVEQDESLATDAPQPDDDLLEIQWKEPAERIVRRVRAASPWPGAFTELGGELLVVTRARVTNDVAKALEPGEAFVRSDGTPVVRAGDVGVELLAARVDGEDEPDVELDRLAIASRIRDTTH